MSRHLSLRSGNPVLGAQTFQSPARTREQMTISGAVNKTAISLVLLVGAGYFTFNAGGMVFLFPALIGAFIVSLITFFKKEWSPITVPIYAVLEGAALGGISFVFNTQYDGIVSTAILLTLSILVALLMAYQSGWIKPTENFKLGLFAATGGIFLLYMVNFVMSFFGSGLGILSINNSSPLSIGISVVIVIIAALNLVLDFDFIEEGAERGAPKYMEWYAAFGLMVTLVWLYLEILRLLAKLNSRD